MQRNSELERLGERLTTDGSAGEGIVVEAGVNERSGKVKEAE